MDVAAVAKAGRRLRARHGNMAMHKDSRASMRDQVRTLRSRHCAPACLHRAVDDETPFYPPLCTKRGESGWLAAMLPERHGRLEPGPHARALLAQEPGRVATPAPVSGSIFTAAVAILAFGSERQRSRPLPHLASGQRIGPFAVTEQPGPILKLPRLPHDVGPGKAILFNRCSANGDMRA